MEPDVSRSSFMKSLLHHRFEKILAHFLKSTSKAERQNSPHKKHLFYIHHYFAIKNIPYTQITNAVCQMCFFLQ